MSITRSGTLSVYRTPAAACSPSSSPRFHHDIANSGDYTRDAIPPGAADARADPGLAPARAQAAVHRPGRRPAVRHGGALPARDLAHARSRRSDSPGRGACGSVCCPSRAGSTQTLNLPRGVALYIALRAVDASGNVGRPVVLKFGDKASILIRPRGRIACDSRPSSGFFLVQNAPRYRSSRHAQGRHPHPRRARQSQGRARAALDRSAGARSPRGSRRRASSATSPRTPSTTTPRTSRRCSRRGSPQLEEKLRSATVIDASDLGTDVVRVGSVVHVKDEARQVDQVHDRRLGRGRTRPR